jgi:hypothetical protein
MTKRLYLIVLTATLLSAVKSGFAQTPTPQKLTLKEAVDYL